MKKILLISLVLLVAVLASGCAGMMGESGIIKKQVNITAAKNKAIYYSPILYNYGVSRWNVVASDPLESPQKYHLEFKEILIKEMKRVFKENGYSLIEKTSSSLDSDSIYIETRISLWSKDAHPKGVSGIRLLVYQGDKFAFEIYYWTFGTYDEMSKTLIEKATNDFINN